MIVQLRANYASVIHQLYVLKQSFIQSLKQLGQLDKYEGVML